MGKEKVGGGRNKNSSRTRGCWRWRKDKRLTVSNTRGCCRWRKDKRLTVSNARCGRSWAPNMVVGFRGIASVEEVVTQARGDMRQHSLAVGWQVVRQGDMGGSAEWSNKNAVAT